MIMKYDKRILLGLQTTYYTDYYRIKINVFRCSVKGKGIRGEKNSQKELINTIIWPVIGKSTAVVFFLRRKSEATVILFS